TRWLRRARRAPARLGSRRARAPPPRRCRPGRAPSSTAPARPDAACRPARHPRTPTPWPWLDYLRFREEVGDLLESLAVVLDDLGLSLDVQLAVLDLELAGERARRQAEVLRHGLGQHAGGAVGGLHAGDHEIRVLLLDGFGQDASRHGHVGALQRLVRDED